MFSALTFHLASISSGAQANLFLAYSTYRAFMLPGNHQGNKEESSVHTIKLISVEKILPRQQLKTDVWLKSNGNKTGFVTLLIQKIYKGQQYPKSVLKGQKGGDVSVS